MASGKSDIWCHFEKLNEKYRSKGKCRYCSAVISITGGVTSNLHRHLKRKHLTINLEDRSKSKQLQCEPRSRSPSFSSKVTLIKKDSAQESEHQAVDNPVGFFHIPPRDRDHDLMSQSSSASTSTEHTPSLLSIAITVPSPRSEFSQSSHSRFIHRPISPNQSLQIDIQLLKMICSEFQPFSLVEGKEFQKFVQMLCPSYHLPSRKTLKNSLLPSLHNSVFEKILEMLEDAPAVCLTCDVWTNINSVIFYAATAHFFSKNGSLTTVLLECSQFVNKHTSENISNWLKNVITKFKINFKICAVVTDNSANIVAAIKILNFRHISCFAHTLNLVVQESIQQSIGNTVAKVKCLVQFFKQSSHAMAKLVEIQGNSNRQILNLKQDVATRWNSTYDMLARIHRNREAVVSTLALCNPKLLLEEADWKVIEESLILLQIFSEVTDEVSSEKNISLSKTCILARGLVKCTKRSLIVHGTEELSESVKLLGTNLLNNLTKRFGEMENNELIGQSIFLDPRFKKQGFGEISLFEETKKKIVQKIQAIRTDLQTPAQLPLNQPTPSTSKIWQEFDESVNMYQMVHDPKDSVIAEIDKFIAEPIVDRHADPMVWWYERKSIFPNLYNLTLKRLCIPATSVPCERIFSKRGQICSKNWSTLSSSKIEKIIFLYHNSNLI